MINSASRMAMVSLVLAVLLSACSGFSSKSAVTQTYLLQPAMPGAAAASAPATSLAVVLPVVAPGLDTERIALVQPDGRLDSFAASRWPDALSLVLHPLIIDAVRASGAWQTVQMDGAPFNAEFVLQVEVRQFAIEYDAAGNPSAKVSLVGTLGRRADRATLRTISIAQTASASANRMSAVIEAFNHALGDSLSQLAAQARP